MRTLRFEVLSKEDMNTLSRELSRAGVMNRTKEEVRPDVAHYTIISGTYAELLERAEGIEPVAESLEELKAAFDDLLSYWKPSAEKRVEELFDESEHGKFMLMMALLESGAVVENDGKLILREVPSLDSLRLELRFPIEEMEGYLEAVEERFNVGMITEFTLAKHYYVEVMEVDRELIESALRIAEDRATEESIVDAMFEGIARSVLADTILEMAWEHRKKNELLEALMEREPIVVDGKNERINVYFDEDSIEDFLKELQTLGYIKVKGNRIWL
ncbi:hypothetical protein [Thermococcus sp.]|uniref:hypothetical protein n=1 Tax=Thermococcus sp. TaxID=35749 RepID=UPI00345DB368